MATKCIAIWFSNEMWNDQYHKPSEPVAVLLARLPFWSSRAVSKFFINSEMAFDLANDLIHCKRWDPSTPPSPYANHLPAPTRLSIDTEFG